ncbi:MAG: quinolinate synthase NadA, partial [Syntrophobacterales bacterium]
MTYTSQQQEVREWLARRDAILLAHNYQPGEIQDIADFTGDSLALSITASQTPAKIIVFAGVHFMAETAAILCPDKTVLLPRLDVGCYMADTITAESLLARKAELFGVPVVTYVNSSAAVKAESDICCTSANAVKVVNSLPGSRVLMVPDKNLAHYTARHTDKEVLTWAGCCNIHDALTAQEVLDTKATHPQALFVAHPECRPEVLDLADAIDKESPVQVPANLIPLECDRITPDLLPLITLEQNHIDRIVAATPDGAANIQDIYPLAPLQEGLLFHHLMEPQSDAYILPLLLAFDSYDRLARMLWGLQKVIDRHDILRTAILWENLPEPVQVVWRKAPLAVETVTLTPEDGDAAEQLRSRIAPGHFRLDIGRAPMMQALIAQDTVHDRWLMAFPVHHLIMDHTTLELLIEEVQAHLAEDTTGLPPALPFRNFVAHARLGVSKQEHEEFFRQLLGDVEEPTAPFGLLNVRGDGSDIDEARLAVDSQLAHRLKAQVQALGVSAASVFHLAWARVLSLLCGRADVVFGTVLFGRMQGGEDADRVLGMFINTLPVRMDISEKPVAQAVHKTHQQLADLLYHEHASLALAQRCSGVLAPAPLFSSLLNYRYSRAQAPDTSAALEGIDVLYGQERTNYPLTLSVDDLEDNFFLTCQIQRSIDPMRICEYLHTTLTHLVEALEQAPQTAIPSIEVLPAAEREQVLYEWNATTVDYPGDQCIHQLFEAQAAKTPDAVAVVYEDEQLTYAQLNSQANRLARYLIG